MTFPISKPRKSKSWRRGAFTLIELILVMAILLTVIAVSAPTLQRFFRGRNMDSEVRRFLSLTRYGQSRAVSEGIPMLLWIDEKTRSYGLRAAPGFLEVDEKAVELDLDKSLTMSVILPQRTTRPMTLQNQSIPGVGSVPMIQFRPTGFLDENSPVSVRFDQDNEETVWINVTANHLRYEIQTNQYAFAK